MSDTVDSTTRSRMMAGIKSRDTRPELVVRRWLHAHGFRYRLHAEGLAGRPDIVLAKHGTVVLVNGCYWHRHSGCRLAYSPKSRVDFWELKFAETVERDRRVLAALVLAGWSVDVIWECQTRSPTIQAQLAELGRTIRSRESISGPG